MLNVNDEIVVNIEKMLYEGLALARHEDFPLFIENACSQDKVKIKISHIKKNYAYGEIIEIIEPSPHRIKPFCPLHNVCGGCQWQYISYDEQLRQKQNIVKETMKKFTGIDIEVLPVLPSPKQTEYRHKIQYPVSQTKVSKRILAGYYKKNSHELINIKFCPIQPRIIDEIVEFIKEETQNLDISAYNEKNNKGMLRHIAFKHSQDNQKTLITLVINTDEVSDDIDSLASRIYKKFQNISGVCVNFNTAKNNFIMGKVTKCLTGEDHYIEKIGDKTYHISADSFFQVNPYSAKVILDNVKSIISSNFEKPDILDAYSGVASFGIYLSDIAQKVVCVEEIEQASNDANSSKFLNKAENVEIVQGEASKTFQKFIENNNAFDVVILDPPRKGCSQDTLDFGAELSKKAIIYISCNPATLARDLKYLHEKGYKTQYIQPVDMFPHTYHIENIAYITKQNQAD